MSELRQLRCDLCGKLAEQQTSVGWFKVERIGIEALAYGDDPGPWHFDTLVCLWHWSNGDLADTPQRTGEGRSLDVAHDVLSPDVEVVKPT